MSYKLFFKSLTTYLMLLVMTLPATQVNASGREVVIPEALIARGETEPDAAWLIGCKHYGCTNFYVSTGALLALPWFERAVENGSVVALYELGQMYLRGDTRDGKRDIQKSLNLFLQAYKRGETRAASIIGHIYRVGKGVIQDPVEAYSWFLVAKAWDHSSKFMDQKMLEMEQLITTQDMASARKRASKLYGDVESRVDYDRLAELVNEFGW